MSWALLCSILILNACKSNNSTNAEIENDSVVGNTTLSVANEKLSASELKNYQQKVNSLLDSHLLKSNFNGAVLIAKGGNILFEKYIGYKDVQHKKDSIDQNTAFHLASTSKPFTGMAILLLVQEGKLSLTDSLQKFFPNFPYKDITVRELLSHRSGLPSYLNFMEDPTKWPKGKMMSNQDVLQFMIQNTPAVYAMPNKRFHYNNTNYILLALIIEKLSGESYPQFMKQHIFDKIGMKHSFVYDPKDVDQHPIMSYKVNGAVWINDMFDNTYGDKNIYSTPRDMLLWDRALYSHNFIRKSLLDSAYTAQSHEKPSIHNYGLGWRLLNFKNGKNVIYHFGRWHGFTPAFGRLTDENAVIIILGNKFNSNIYHVAKEVYQVFGNYGDSTLENSTEDSANDETASVSTPTPVKKVVAAVAPKPTKKQNIVKTTATAVAPKPTKKQNIVKKTATAVAPKPTKKQNIVKKTATAVVPKSTKKQNLKKNN